jgi:hypothetical protein
MTNDNSFKAMPFMGEQEKRNFKPSIKKNYLFLIAGLMWFCVGVMLISFARSWLLGYQGNNGLLLAAGGIILGLLTHHFGFLKIVDKNLIRIKPMDEKPCAFSFMSWKSYLLVIIMISMGVILKNSGLPKHYLAIVYLAIGLALSLSSIRYFRVFRDQIKNN